MRFCIILCPTPYSSSSYFISLATMNFISTMLDRGVKISSLPPEAKFLQVWGKNNYIYIQIDRFHLSIYIYTYIYSAREQKPTASKILKTKTALFKRDTREPARVKLLEEPSSPVPDDYQITDFQSFPFVSPLTAHSCGVLGITATHCRCQPVLFYCQWQTEHI